MDLPSVKIRRILYATDLSENARIAFTYAVSLAEQYDAQIVILHALLEDTIWLSLILGRQNGKRLSRSITGRLKIS